MGFPGGLDGKESACNVGDLGSIPGLGRCPGGHGNPLQCSCLENPHEQRSLAGYSPRGHNESDTTERLSRALHKGSDSQFLLDFYIDLLFSKTLLSFSEILPLVKSSWLYEIIS